MTGNLQAPVVWSEECLRHDPGGEVWLGVRDAGTEVPERALVVRAALAAAGAPEVPAAAHGDEVLRAVHDPALLEHLAGVWADWERAGFPAEYGRDRVVPYVFPTEGMLGGLPARMPPAVHGRAGRFCYDTMTLVGPGSWAAIRGAADAALTAADLVSSGTPLAYALCRPPGHHVTRAGYGGSCYLNNAAIAAQALVAAGAGRVAVLDIDAHHGNGTQSVFYARGDVWYGSVHVDPGAGWFPHYAGYADERGAGPGEGANQNRPLAPGTGDEGWLAAVRDLCAAAAAHGPDAVVVSLGLDAAEADPESPLRVTEAGYRQAGRLTAALAPTVLVQEGGYDLATLGPLTVAALTGAAEALKPVWAPGLVQRSEDGVQPAVERPAQFQYRDIFPCVQRVVVDQFQQRVIHLRAEPGHLRSRQNLLRLRRDRRDDQQIQAPELVPLFLQQVVRLVRGHVTGQVRAQRLGQRRLPGAVRPGDPDPHPRLRFLWRLPRRFYGGRGDVPLLPAS